MAIGWVALLLLYAAPVRFQGPGTHATETPAAHAACAAHWDTHLANNRRLVIMTWVGLLLQSVGGRMFLYTLRRLLPDAPPFESEAARHRFIGMSARVVGTFLMLGKLLVRFVIPWVLLSRAIFFYRCIDRYQGAVKIFISSLLTLVYIFFCYVIETWGLAEGL